MVFRWDIHSQSLFSLSILLRCFFLDTELYRLNKMLPPSGDVYDPLLPIIWMTMYDDLKMKNNSIHRSISGEIMMELNSMYHPVRNANEIIQKRILFRHSMD